jgi:hypothetical protein
LLIGPAAPLAHSTAAAAAALSDSPAKAFAAAPGSLKPRILSVGTLYEPVRDHVWLRSESPRPPRPGRRLHQSAFTDFVIFEEDMSNHEFLQERLETLALIQKCNIMMQKLRETDNSSRSEEMSFQKTLSGS